MTNLSKRIDTDDIANLAVTLEKLSQSVQDAIGGGAYTPPVTVKGDLFTFSTVPAKLGRGTDGQVLSTLASETTGLKWITLPSSSSPLSTKGQIYTHDNSADAALNVGSDGNLLVADHLATNGIRWATAAPVTYNGQASNQSEGATVTITADQVNCIRASGDLTALTLALSSTHKDGSIYRITSMANVAGITWTLPGGFDWAGGVTPPASLAKGDHFSIMVEDYNQYFWFV